MIFLLSFLTIVTLLLPFSTYYLGWLSLVSLVPWLFLFQFMIDKKYTNRKQFLIIWLVGIFSFFGVLGWSLQTNPQRWAFVSGWQAITGQWLIYTVFVLLFSIQYAVFAALYLKLKPKLLDWRSYLIIPSIWVISEAARSLFFSLVMYGKGSLVGLHWNFGVLGAAASVTPLVYLSRLVGMFGLSFVVVMIGVSIYWIIKKQYKLPVIILSIISLVTFISWIAWRVPVNSKQIQVGYVQLAQNFDNYENGDSYFDELSNMVKNRSTKNDILVLPEYSNFFVDTGKSYLAHQIAGDVTSDDGLIITSVSNDVDSHTHKNRLEIYNPKGEVVTTQDKTFLIPIGEYLPNLVVGLYKLGGMNQALKMHEDARIVAQGTDPNKPITVRGISLASLACSGAITPELYRGLVNGGAEIMTNSASLGAFTDATLYHAQSRQFAHFMAVANSRPFVQSAGGAYSFVIDNNGDFVSQTDNLGTNYDSVTLQVTKSKTPYTVLGEWVIFFSLSAVLYFYFRPREIKD